MLFIDYEHWSLVRCVSWNQTWMWWNTHTSCSWWVKHPHLKRTGPELKGLKFNVDMQPMLQTERLKWQMMMKMSHRSPDVRREGWNLNVTQHQTHQRWSCDPWTHHSVEKTEGSSPQHEFISLKPVEWHSSAPGFIPSLLPAASAALVMKPNTSCTGVSQ